MESHEYHALEPLNNQPLFKYWLRCLLREDMLNCADREMSKWQVKRKLSLSDKKSANGFIFSDHEHDESELINMTKNYEKWQVTRKIVKFAIFRNFRKFC